MSPYGRVQSLRRFRSESRLVTLQEFLSHSPATFAMTTENQRLVLADCRRFV